MSRNEKGFSLLEVLVAFSILAGSLGVLYQIFSRGTQAMLIAEETTRAVMIAETKLAAWDPEHFTLPVQGTVDDKYRWVLSTRPYSTTRAATASTGVRLQEVKLQVSWASLGKPRSVDLHSLRLLSDK